MNWCWVEKEKKNELWFCLQGVAYKLKISKMQTNTRTAAIIFFLSLTCIETYRKHLHLLCKTVLFDMLFDQKITFLIRHVTPIFAEIQQGNVGFSLGD